MGNLTLTIFTISKKEILNTSGNKIILIKT